MDGRLGWRPYQDIPSGGLFSSIFYGGQHSGPKVPLGSVAVVRRVLEWEPVA